MSGTENREKKQRSMGRIEVQVRLAIGIGAKMREEDLEFHAFRDGRGVCPIPKGPVWCGLQHPDLATLADAEKFIESTCAGDDRFSGATFRIIRVASEGVVTVERTPKVTLPARVEASAVDATA